MLCEWQTRDAAAWLALSRLCQRLGDRDQARETREHCRKPAPELSAVKEALRDWQSRIGQRKDNQ
jgi:hypothetical protein